VKLLLISGLCLIILMVLGVLCIVLMQTTKELDQALSRGLYIGLNGILTFSHNDAQLVAAKTVPLDRLLLETDAPYLTPKPYRGKVNQSKYIRVIAEFLSSLRGESLKTMALVTTRNAEMLFNIKYESRT
jgi:TatD DNase family protein